MIKLIVSDIDGTLVPEGTNDINPEIFSLIRRLKSQGIYFVVASGRHKYSIENLFAPIKEDIFYITSNGAYVGTYNKKLAVSDISKETAKALIKDFETDIGQPYLVETCVTAYTPCPDPSFTKLLTDNYGYEMNHCNSIDDISEDIIKLCLYQPGNALDIDEAWLKKWNKVCKAVISGTHWIDYMAQNTNKGTALARLQETLGITIHETLAFGDQINDIEMLKQAYFSYAVGNANPTVKNAARFICDTCENNGVITTISSFLENTK